MRFEYTIKKTKGRNLRISINKRGEVFLHVPTLYPRFLAKRFLNSKSEWVEKSLEKIRSTPPNLPSKEERKSKKEIRKDYLSKKEDARKLVAEKLSVWKQIYLQNHGIELNWKKVAIKNSKTRWGSCSSKKNLNFSYRIIDLPEQAQDYLIVHELCHLKEMNHSKNFWHLVSLGVGDAKHLRKELRKFNLQNI